MNKQQKQALVETATCEWFARCTNNASGLVLHPVLPPVPTCQRCADKFDLEFVDLDNVELEG